MEHVFFFLLFYNVVSDFVAKPNPTPEVFPNPAEQVLPWFKLASHANEHDALAEYRLI